MLGLGNRRQDGDEDMPVGALSKIQSIMARNKHRQMERKIRSFTIACSVLFTGVGLSVYHHIDTEKQASVKETAFGYAVEFSKTEAPLHIGQPVLANGGRTAYIPVRFEDISVMPSNPDDYALLIATPSSKDISYQVQSQFMMFDKGYGAIVLHGSPSIKNQVLTLLLRNDKLLIDDEYEDFEAKSFSDQLKVFDIAIFEINPNAQNVRFTKQLDSSDVKASDVYRVLYGDKMVYDIQQKILDNERKVEVLLKRIAEYKDRFLRNGFVLVDDPPYLREDWRPTGAEPVNIKASLRDGLYIEGGRVHVNEMQSTLDTTASQDVNVQSDSDAVTFPQYLNHMDGVETTASEEFVDMQEAWLELQTMFSEVLTLKKDIYVKYAKELLSVERSMQRQDSAALLSASSTDANRMLVDVDVSIKTPDGVPHNETPIADYQ